MSKRKILIISTICILCLSIGIVFAAFMFNQVVSSNADVGNIHIVNQQFVTYANEVDPTNYPGGKADNDYLDDIKERSQTGTAFQASSIMCYATEKEGYSEEEIATTSNYFYLNQLGIKASFYADIPVCVRIKFQDAWLKIKTYNGNTLDPEYIKKGQFDVPLSPGSGWAYHEGSNSYNYVGTNNLSAVISPSTIDNPFEAQFDLASNYFYHVPESQTITNGHVAVLVQVSFTLEVIQANRAYKVWGYNPNNLS